MPVCRSMSKPIEQIDEISPIEAKGPVGRPLRRQLLFIPPFNSQLNSLKNIKNNTYGTVLFENQTILSNRTLSRPPSVPALIIIKPSKPGCTNTYASTLSLDQLSLLFGNARASRDSQGLHYSGEPLLAFEFIKIK